MICFAIQVCVSCPKSAAVIVMAILSHFRSMKCLCDSFVFKSAMCNPCKFAEGNILKKSEIKLL